MNQASLSKRLKLLVLLVFLCALVVYTVALPLITAHYTPFSESSTARFAWLGMIWLTAVPLYLALAYAWQIATRIGQNRSFSRENALALRHISTLALIDTVFLLLGNVLLCLVGMNRLTLLVFSLLFCFLGFLLTVAAAALSHLVQRAADLQEESDLTI